MLGFILLYYYNKIIKYLYIKYGCEILLLENTCKKLCTNFYKVIQMTKSLGFGPEYDLIIIIELKDTLVNVKNIYLMIYLMKTYI